MPSSSQGNPSLIVASDRLRRGSKSSMRGNSLRLLERELLGSSGHGALLVAITAALLPTDTTLCGAQKAAASIDRLGVVGLGCTHLQAPPGSGSVAPFASRPRFGMSYTASMLFILACIAIGTPAALAVCIWIDRCAQRQPRA